MTCRTPTPQSLPAGPRLSSPQIPTPPSRPWVRTSAPGAYCVSITGSHVHNVQEGITLNTQDSIAQNDEIDHWSDNAFTHAGSYQIFQGNYLHDPVDVGLTYHVDGFQGEGLPLPSGQTSKTFTQINIVGNKIIDRVDPANPWPMTMTGIDDYSGVGWLVWDNHNVINNVMVTGGRSSF